jgi:hypothetical protein
MRANSGTDQAVDTLLRAARMTTCDWHIPLDQGLGPATRANPVPADTQRLSRVTTVRALARFESGRTAEALRDLLALMTLGRHLTWHTPGSYRLTGCGAEAMAIDAVAQHLCALSRRQLADLRDQLAHLPAPAALPDTVAVDKELLLSEFRRAGADNSSKSTLFRGFWSVGQSGIAARMDQVARLTALPHDQFPAAWSAYRADVGDNFIGDVTKSYQGMRELDDQLQVRRAMLLAAIEIRLAGPDATPTITDPFTHHPFRHTPPADNGFVVLSDGAPALRVGR